jgi:hypothetical protein
MHIIQEDYERSLTRESKEKPAHFAEERGLTGAVGKAWLRDGAQSREAIRERPVLLEDLNPRSVWRGFGAVIAMADEYERARDARRLASIFGERGLPYACFAAKNDKATTPGECRAELLAEETSLTRAPDQELRPAAGCSGAHHIKFSHGKRRTRAIRNLPASCSAIALLGRCEYTFSISAEAAPVCCTSVGL